MLEGIFLKSMYIYIGYNKYHVSNQILVNSKVVLLVSIIYICSLYI